MPDKDNDSLFDVASQLQSGGTNTGSNDTTVSFDARLVSEGAKQEGLFRSESLFYEQVPSGDNEEE